MSTEFLIKVEKLHEGAYLPTEPATPGSIGYDFFTPVDFDVPAGQLTVVPLGIKLALPEGYSLILKEKSGMAITYPGLILVAGVVDHDYRGEIKVGFFNASSTGIWISAGKKIVQGVLVKNLRVPVEQVSDLDETVRGEGGFGSTGTTFEGGK